MIEAFEVGERVTALGQRPVTITYGPFMSAFDRHEMYVAADGAGRERSYQTTDLTALPAFSVGDTVKYEYGGGGKLVAGPFKSGYHDEAIWVVEKADGTHMTPTQNSLTKVAPVDEPIKVGDRVRVLVNGANYADVRAGDVFTVAGLEQHGDPGVRTTAIPGRDDGWFFSLTNVERVDEPANTYTLDGVTYDLAAQYVDIEGDTWEFSTAIRSGPGTDDCQNDGTPVGRCAGSPSSLAAAVRRYGPLTKI